MALINFRVKKYPEGWIVEVQLLFWWKHITYYSGLPDSPYYYKTPEEARQGALRQLGEDISFSFYQ